MITDEAFAPLWLGILDTESDGRLLSGPAGGPVPERGMARILERRNGVPERWRDVDLEDLRQTCSLTGSALPAPASTNGREDVTVCVCTRDRTTQLSRCLESLAEALGGDTELLIVDNAPSDTRTAQLVAELKGRMPNARYVLEPAPGLSRARNTGLRHATGDIVAFTDDDVVVDARWLHGVREGFAGGHEVAVVTGMVPPAQISTVAQKRFDDLSEPWTYEVARSCYSMTTREEAPFFFPWSAGHIGAGANMAVRREVILDLGGFDEALGAGRRTGAGEDLEIFIRVLRRGFSVVYEPQSLVWHFHRETEDEFLSQMTEHRIAIGAVIAAVLRQSRRREPLFDVAGQLLSRARRRSGESRPDTGERPGEPIVSVSLAAEIRPATRGFLLYWRELADTKRRERLRPF